MGGALRLLGELFEGALALVRYLDDFPSVNRATRTVIEVVSKITEGEFDQISWSEYLVIFISVGVFVGLGLVIRLRLRQRRTLPQLSR